MGHTSLSRLTTAARDCSPVTGSLIRSPADPRHCLARAALGRKKSTSLRIHHTSHSLLPATSSTTHNNGWSLHAEGRQSSLSESETHAVFLFPRRYHPLWLAEQGQLNSASGSITRAWHSLHARPNTDRWLSSRPRQRCASRGSVWHVGTRTWPFFFVTSIERLDGTVAAQVRKRLASRQLPWEQSGMACTSW